METQFGKWASWREAVKKSYKEKASGRLTEIKMKHSAKVFLAALAIVFAIQVTFDLNDYSNDPGIVFMLRVFIACLLAAAFTFFWGESKKRHP
jgi:protein-S-isoprenylcysteine O-methyltransferase Ste14